MRRAKRSIPLLLGLVAVAALIALTGGCGGGSTSTSTPSRSTSSESGKEASAAFLRPKSPNNKFVTFGEEAPAEEREAASKVLEENLKARAAADFATQCATLDGAGIEQVVGISKRGKAARAKCPNALKELAEPLSGSKQIRADTLGGPIAALRVEGAKAYALYHGSDNKDYSIPMGKEGGEWRVGALLTTELG